MAVLYYLAKSTNFFPDQAIQGIIIRSGGMLNPDIMYMKSRNIETPIVV